MKKRFHQNLKNKFINKVDAFENFLRSYSTTLTFIGIVVVLFVWFTDHRISLKTLKIGYDIEGCYNLSQSNIYTSPLLTSDSQSLRKYRLDFMRDNTSEIIMGVIAKEDISSFIGVMINMENANALLTMNNLQPSLGLRTVSASVRDALYSLGFTEEYCNNTVPKKFSS